MRFSVVIPVFNDTSALPEFLRRFFAMVDAGAHEAELILVDDGSCDEAWQQLLDIRSAHAGRAVVLIRLAHNHGQQVATLCGLLHCKTDMLVTLDADMQHPPEVISLLLEALVSERLELVYGAGSSGHGVLRRLLSFIYRGLASLVGSAFFHASSFRAMRRSIVERLEQQMTEKTVSIDDVLRELVSEAGYVPFPHQKRHHGASSYTWPRLIASVSVNAYHSRQLRPVALRISTVVFVLSMGNLVAGNPLFSSSASAGLLISAVLLLGVTHMITARRQSLPLKEQFTVREMVGG